ncbi:MAG: hypothetical protein N2515_10340, partial [Deltaproteobacteria bacterium]|nr:hypothetical protein [Deltaproteobacteria bacterium]
LCAAWLLVELRHREHAPLPSLPPFFRPFRTEPERIRLRSRDEVFEIQATWGREFRAELRLGDESLRVQRGVIDLEPALSDQRKGRARIESDGLLFAFRFVVTPTEIHIHTDGESHSFVRWSRFPPPSLESPASGLVAPMPGRILRVHATVGQKVRAGEVLFVMEAMKTEHAICAPRSGEITRVFGEEGKQVEAGEVLALIEDPEKGD